MKKRTPDIIIPWEMILLSILSTKDMYGAQIEKRIKEFSEEKCPIPVSPFYQILYQLADAKYLEFYEKPKGRRLTVVYYHITKKGRERLDMLLKEFRDSVSSVENIISICTSSNQ